MKQLMFSVLAAFVLSALAACSKPHSSPETPGICGTVYTPFPDSFSFGRAYGFCDSNCARFYLVVNPGSDSGRVYPDSMNRYTGTTLFRSTPLAAADYSLAMALAGNLRLLPEAGNITDTTFGAPDSHDQGGLYFSFRINGVKHTWVVDQDTAAQPEHMRSYFKQANSVIDALPL